jgi:hypothetical protein
LISRTISRAATAALAIAAAFALAVVLTQTAQAQTYKVIHNFTGGADGRTPDAGLVMDKAGNLYGTTTAGGYTGGNCSSVGGCGSVFKMSNSGYGWILIPLYDFQGGLDGAAPAATLTFGPDGSLYGTTADAGLLGYRYGTSGTGGGNECCGTVFKLTPPTSASPNAMGRWTHTVLYRFRGYPDDGSQPYHSPATFDRNGNIYLTTYEGGNLVIGGGTVSTLKPSNGGWTESILYNFQYPEWDGHYPMSGVIFDPAGNLDGTTFFDGRPYGGYGTVFQLIPSAGGWTEKILYTFQGGSDGAWPVAGLVSDPRGNLYGATAGGYPQPYATVFMLGPSPGGWNFKVIYTFDNSLENPEATLAMDPAGNLYGTTCDNGYLAYDGHVFKLTPGPSGWTYTSLHDFCTSGNCSDGGGARSGVLLGANGNIYGTADIGGKYGGGVVFEITP